MTLLVRSWNQARGGLLHPGTAAAAGVVGIGGARSSELQ